MVLHPLVQLALRLIVLAVVQLDLVGGVHEIFIAILQGFYKCDNTADDGKPGPFVSLAEPLLLLQLDVNAAVRVVDGDGGTLGSAHHDALHEGLSADAGLMLCIAQY